MAPGHRVLVDDECSGEAAWERAMHALPFAL
jgi:hypothetical protein